MSRSRRRRWWPVVVSLLVALLVAYAVVTVLVFVRPDLGSVRQPQAVVVLGGYGDRADQGIAVARADHIRTVALSTTPLCPKVARLHIDCFWPVPLSTQGEARFIATAARLHHWDRIVVVAGTTQVSRARLRIDRCYQGQVAFVGVDPDGFFGWIHDIAYDQAAMVKAVVWQRGC